jgi:hypothetical protein
MRSLILKKVLWTLLLFALVACGALALARQQNHSAQSKTQQGADKDHSMSAMSDTHHMEMGPHMKMTMLRPLQPGDQERADEIVKIAHKELEKYKDCKAALADGYKIFLPNVPQKVYHFTNNWYALKAEFTFDPVHPTSLLYEKTNDGYKLIGAMYTAPARATEDDLNKRVPLSIAQWHQHVNFCLPPSDKKQEMYGAHPRFGLAGSIATKEECDKAGGRFVPRIFGWMVHVYPYEKSSEEIWGLEHPMMNEQMMNMHH